MLNLFLHRIQLLCVMLVTGSFSCFVHAGATNAPLQAMISFSEQVVLTGSPPCFLVGTIEGTGVIPTLGNESVALTSTDCINPLPPTFTSNAFSSSHVVLNTSRGALLATYSGILSSKGVITGTFVIYGGSGDFANASGSGTLFGFETIDPTGGTGQIKLKGTLSY